MIAIIDYGMGNLRSVQKGFESVGAEATITENPQIINDAHKIVLPGVGAIKPAVEKLEKLGLISVLEKNVQSGKLFLGICVGFQLLFELSYEGGEVECLGFIPGIVQKFEKLKIPQIGWNTINIESTQSALFQNIKNESYVYFCHSYYATPSVKSTITSTTEYGINYASSVQKDNVFGVQFHPEKSQTIGLTLLKNFSQIKDT